MRAILLGLVRVYQVTISSALPRSCKYYPSCSHYAVSALQEYGVLRGLVLISWRLLRCNPFSYGGYDPVTSPARVSSLRRSPRRAGSGRVVDTMGSIFGPLSGAFFWLLEFLHTNLGISWSWSIVVLTIIVRIILIPITWRQIKSMRAMQLLAPQIKELQQKYKDDRELLNRKTMEFYQANKVSPFGSCLPLLLQMPVFLGLFYMLRWAGTANPSPEVLSHASYAGVFLNPHVGWLWIKDITAFDYILMFVYMASQFVASWQTARKSPGQQKMIAYFMPIIVGIFMYIGKWPAGLFIYWVTSNLWTIAQQFVMERVVPAPVPVTTTGGKTSQTGGSGVTGPTRKSKPGRPASGKTAPAKTSPGKTAPGKPSPAKTSSGKAPAKGTPGKPVATKVAPGKAVPGKAAPGKAGAGKAGARKVPASAASGKLVPGKPVPGKTAPAKAVSGKVSSTKEGSRSTSSGVAPAGKATAGVKPTSAAPGKRESRAQGARAGQAGAAADRATPAESPRGSTPGERAPMIDDTPAKTTPAEAASNIATAGKSGGTSSGEPIGTQKEATSGSGQRANSGDGNSEGSGRA